MTIEVDCDIDKYLYTRLEWQAHSGRSEGTLQWFTIGWLGFRTLRTCRSNVQQAPSVRLHAPVDDNSDTIFDPVIPITLHNMLFKLGSTFQMPIDRQTRFAL